MFPTPMALPLARCGNYIYPRAILPPLRLWLCTWPTNDDSGPPNFPVTYLRPFHWSHIPDTVITLSLWLRYFGLLSPGLRMLRGGWRNINGPGGQWAWSIFSPWENSGVERFELDFMKCGAFFLIFTAKCLMSLDGKIINLLLFCWWGRFLWMLKPFGRCGFLTCQRYHYMSGFFLRWGFLSELITSGMLRRSNGMRLPTESW